MEICKRITKHKSTIRNRMVELPIPKHFVENNHSINQLKFKVMDSVPELRRGGDRQTKLYEKEFMWIKRLDSLAPKGLNMEYKLQSIA